MHQLEFGEIDINNKLYISSTCKSCLNACKVYTISLTSCVYCKKYKRSREGY